MKKWKRGACLALCLAFMLGAGGSVSAESFSAITNETIKEKEGQISQAEEERKQLESNLTDMKKLKEELEGKKADLKNYVEQLDASLATIESKITELKGQIAAKEEELAAMQEELERAVATEEKQYEQMKARIRLIYERGDAYYLDVLLTADSLGDLLNRMDYVDALQAYEQRTLEEYRQNRQWVELCKAELEAEKQVLDQARANMEQEQRNMEDLIQEKSKKINEYEGDINNKEQAIKEYEAMIAEQNEVIEQLEAAVAEERKRILESSGMVLTYDGGVFKFPLASYTRVSDDYGNRIHPTLGVPQFHNGVDLAAPKGTAIYAAYDGVVVAATYSATMGNYVMLDHGDSLYTIYMHASALYVQKDDVVARGETIAAVGSTGRSTGNHLHFSVRRNGAYVSPWEFLSP